MRGTYSGKKLDRKALLDAMTDKLTTYRGGVTMVRFRSNLLISATELSPPDFATRVLGMLVRSP